MFDLLLTAPMVPFTLSLALLMGLLTLELVFALLGGTLLGMGADPDLDIDLDVGGLDTPDLDIAGFEAAGIDIDAFADADIDLGDFELADPVAEADVAAPSGTTAWLGIGQVPTILWIAALLLGFGVSGVLIQSVVSGVLGSPLPATFAALPALFAGLWFARGFGKTLARLIPKTESAALSRRAFGRRLGKVTQGTARRGSLAEVRVTDRHGNFHYLRAEPLADNDVIEQGTEVLVLRERRSDAYRLVAVE